MHWIGPHSRLIVGILADLFTFAGGLILARDAFQRLKELNEDRIIEHFRSRFPNLNLADPAERRARMSARWAARGLILLAIGFALQILSRCLEGG
jgi:hypothetical protein